MSDPEDPSGLLIAKSHLPSHIQEILNTPPLKLRSILHRNWREYSEDLIDMWLDRCFPTTEALLSITIDSSKHSFAETIRRINFIRAAHFFHAVDFWAPKGPNWANTKELPHITDGHAYLTILLADEPWQRELSGVVHTAAHLGYNTFHTILMGPTASADFAKDRTNDHFRTMMVKHAKSRPKNENSVSLAESKTIFEGKWKSWSSHFNGPGREALLTKIAVDFDKLYPNTLKLPPNMVDVSTTNTTSSAPSTPQKRPPTPTPLSSAAKRGRRRPAEPIIIPDEPEEHLTESTPAEKAMKIEIDEEEEESAPFAYHPPEKGQIYLALDMKGLNMLERKLHRELDLEGSGSCGCSMAKLRYNTSRLDNILAPSGNKMIYLDSFVQMYYKIVGLTKNDDGALCDYHLILLGEFLNLPAGDRQYFKWMDESEEVVRQLVDEHLPPIPEIPLVAEGVVKRNGGMMPAIKTPTIDPTSTSPLGDWSTKGAYNYMSGLDHLLKHKELAKLINEDTQSLIHHHRMKPSGLRFVQGTYSLTQQMIQKDEKLYKLAAQLRGDGIITMASYPLPPLIFDGTETTFVEGDLQATAASGVGRKYIDVYATAQSPEKNGGWTIGTFDTSECTDALAHAAAYLGASDIPFSHTSFDWQITQKPPLSNWIQRAVQYKDLHSSIVKGLPVLLEHTLKTGNTLFVRSNNIIRLAADSEESREQLKRKPVVIFRNRYVALYDKDEVELLNSGPITVDGVKRQIYTPNEFATAANVAQWYTKLWVPWTKEVAWGAQVKVPTSGSIPSMLGGQLQGLDPSLINELRHLLAPNQSSSESNEERARQCRTSAVQAYRFQFLQELNLYQARSFGAVLLMTGAHRTFKEEPLRFDKPEEELDEKNQQMLKKYPLWGTNVKGQLWITYDPDRHDLTTPELVDIKQIRSDFSKVCIWLEERYNYRRNLPKSAPTSAKKKVVRTPTIKKLGITKAFAPDSSPQS